MSNSFRTQREDVVARRKATEQHFRVIERRPFPGDCHPISKTDLEILLAVIPVEMVHGLRSIELRPRNHEVGGPFAQYRVKAKSIILYSVPHSWEFNAFYPSLAREVGNAGAEVTHDGSRMRVAWPDEDRLRLWYFFDVFGHELGHHFNNQFKHKNGRSSDRRAAERFAELNSAKLREHVTRIMKEKKANKSWMSTAHNQLNFFPSHRNDAVTSHQTLAHNMKPLFVITILAAFLPACSSAPRAILDTAHFPVSQISTKVIRKGQPTGDIGGVKAHFDYARIEGQWAEPGFKKYTKDGTYYGSSKYRWWFVELYCSATDKDTNAILNATDGYKARLGRAGNASARIYPRFERKQFEWGKAVSFLVQYQNDNTNYVPNNGMLLYEVHGLTKDRVYVRAQFGVTHPRLEEFGEGVRDHRDGNPEDPHSPMRKDPDYRLVETVSGSSFEPSLKKIDEFVNSFVIKR